MTYFSLYFAQETLRVGIQHRKRYGKRGRTHTGKTGSEERIVLLSEITAVMSVHLIELVGDTEIATMHTLQFLSKTHPPVEVGPVKIEDATTCAVHLLHT